MRGNVILAQLATSNANQAPASAVARPQVSAQARFSMLVMHCDPRHLLANTRFKTVAFDFHTNRDSYHFFTKT